MEDYRWVLLRDGVILDVCYGSITQLKDYVDCVMDKHGVDIYYKAPIEAQIIKILDTIYDVNGYSFYLNSGVYIRVYKGGTYCDEENTI
jgi:hypothetical protein